MTTINTDVQGWTYLKSTYTRTDSPGTLFTFGSTSGLVTFGSNSRTRNSNPSWRVNVAKLTDASTDYSRREWVEVVSYLMSGESLTVTPGYTIRGNCQKSSFGGGYSLVNSSDDLVLRDQALARIKNRLASHYGNVQAAVPLAELRELRKTILGIAEVSAGMLHAMTAIRKTRGASAYKWASDAWLNFNFGVSPLIKDAASIALAIQDYMDRKDHHTRLTGSASKDWISGLKETGETGMYGAGVSTRSTAHHSLSYKYIGGFNLLVSAGNNYGVLDHLGFTIDSLPSIAWELVPYSWVIDYFTTVGDYFGDTFTVPSGGTKYLTLNKRYICEIDVDPSFVASPGTLIMSQSIRPGRYKYIEFTRTKLSSLPRAGLHLKSLDTVGHNAVTKLLNLASVLSSGLKQK